MNARSTWWTTATIATALIAVAAMASAQDRTAAPVAQVTGAWKVSLHGQHVISVGMELTQDGSKVTGTLMLWNGDVDLQGSFEGGVLKVAGTLTPNDGSHGGERGVEAALMDDGTLDGTIAVSATGRMKLTAERFKERPARTAAAVTPTAPASGPAAAFAGPWTLSVTMGAETQTFRLSLSAAGESLTGSLGSDHTGALMIRDAQITDNTLDFAVQMTGTPQVITFHATLASAQSLSGTMVGPMGAVPFTGTRAK